MAVQSRTPGRAYESAATWSDEMNARVSDNAYATWTTAVISNAGILIFDDCGFSLPRTAAVTGIEVRVERKASVASQIFDLDVQLKAADAGGGAVASAGVDKADSAVFWPTTDTVIVYGGPSDTWGRQWAAEEINAMGFGLFFRPRNSVASAVTASVDAVTILVYYVDNSLPVVRLRSPYPPHGTLLQILPSAVKYGAMLMRPQLAAFRVPRSDPNLDLWAHLFQVGMMVTIERSDGLHPYVGFIKRKTVGKGDPEATFECQDHTWLLQQAHTRRSGSVRSSSGQLLVDTLREIDSRGLPPLFLRLDNIEGGPHLDYNYELDQGLDFLGRVHSMTGWEWGFDYELDEADVHTFLSWSQRRGQDLRTQVVWEEQAHFEDVTLTQDAKGFAAAAVVVGGSGALSDRPAVAVNPQGRAVDGIAAQSARLASLAGAVPSPALAGTRLLFERQVTDQEALFAAGQQLLDSPLNVAEQLSFAVVEGQIDTRRLAVGNVVTARLADTDLGIGLERAVRITAISFEPEKGVHGIESQIRPVYEGGDIG